jgi:sugar phosphate isomerase/epimerase
MISIGMSTSCVYPLGMEQAFRLAHLAGYDGVEIMITNDPGTQDADGLLKLSERYSMPILSVHAPVLLLTTFVYGRDPRVKLEKSAEHADRLGAGSVVVHPPFRWQSDYADQFETIVRETAQATGVDICVENMFPWKVGGRGIKAYKPSPDPLEMDVDAMTLDFSHASLAGRDSLQMAQAMGDKLKHVHLCDGSKSADEGQILDEHLPPGRGTQPVAETLTWLAENHWTGNVVAEVITRKEKEQQPKLDVLVETVAFAKRYIGQEHAERDPLAVGAQVMQSARKERKAAKREARDTERS